MPNASTSLSFNNTTDTKLFDNTVLCPVYI